MGQSPILEKITPRLVRLPWQHMDMQAGKQHQIVTKNTPSPSNKSARIITSINTYKVGRGMISELNSMDQCGYLATWFYISVFYMGLDILVF